MAYIYPKIPSSFQIAVIFKIYKQAVLKLCLEFVILFILIFKNGVVWVCLFPNHTKTTGSIELTFDIQVILTILYLKQAYIYPEIPSSFLISDIWKICKQRKQIFFNLWIQLLWTSLVGKSRDKLFSYMSTLVKHGYAAILH